MAEHSSQRGSKHSKAREKSVSGHLSESTSMDSVVSHEVMQLAGAYGGASVRETQEQGLSEQGSRYSVMMGMEKQLNYPCSTRSINVDKAGSQRRVNIGLLLCLKKALGSLRRNRS